MIFPRMLGRPGGQVYLNQYSDSWIQSWISRNCKGVMPEQSPTLDAHVCQRMVEECHRYYGLEWSWGGWMENRSTLWRGSYMDKDDRYIHLGVDFNAYEGTHVHLDRPGQVLLIDDDHPEEHGWGKRVFIRLAEVPIVLLYAHIDTVCKKASHLQQGSQLGTIAPPRHNGGWYPHVHVQAMSTDRYKEFRNDPAGLDGYGQFGRVPALAREFPDPMQFVRVS